MSAVWHAHIANTNEYVIRLASHSDEFCASGPARHLWLEWIRRTAGEKGKDGQLLRYKYSVISEVCKAGIFTRSHDYFSPQTIKQNHNQVANSNNILVSLDHFDVNNNYQPSCMQLSFTHSDAKFIHLISYKKGSKRTVWILVKLGAFVSIGSILLDIKCPLYEWISLTL